MTFRSQRGIVLIQVLLVSAILAVITISFVKKANSSIDIANTAIDRSNALLSIETAESSLLFDLLSGRPFEASSGFFNRFDKPFYFDGVVAQMQDIAGLFRVAPSGTEGLAKLLVEFGYSEDNAFRAASAFEDWQDIDSNTRPNGAEQAEYSGSVLVRNSAIQTIDELFLIKNFERDQRLIDAITIYSVGYFNPMSAPKEVMSLHVSNKELVNTILELRDKGVLTETDFVRLSGITPNDAVMLTPSRAFRLKLKAEVGQANYKISKEIKIDPYGREPLVLWSSNRN